MAFSWSRLGDYFAAVATLGVQDDPQKQRAIAVLLGLEEKVVEEVAEKPPPPPPPETPPQPRPQPAAPPPSATTAPSPPDPTRATRSRPRLEMTLTPTRAEKRTRPDWLEHVAPLAPPRSEIVKPAAPAPLFAKRTSRTLLSTAMAADRETNAVDLDAIINAVGRGVRVRRVPRRVVPSLSRGVHVLVDRGPSAAPFLADQDLLVEQIRVVAGRDRVQVLRFDPSRDFIAGSGPRHRWIDYFALSPHPLPGVPIVLLSDLGIAAMPLEGSATADEWRAFIARIRSRGHRLLAFVPYGRDRWPPALRAQVVMVAWDRRTNIQAVRRAFGRRVARRRAAE